MPNTLVHMGVGQIVSRTLFRDVDDKWVYIGCIIPDIPWIIQRVAIFALPGLDLVDLRLYTVVQASFAFCLILSAAVAILARFGLQLWILLGFNCLLHLILDATQIKWATGVHFLAPFSWRMVDLGFFWPESILAYAMTIIGLILIFWRWRFTWAKPVQFISPKPIQFITAVGLLIIYFGVPPFLMSGPQKANNHFTATLKAHATRPGSIIAFDRCSYDPDTQSIQVFTGETIYVSGVQWPHESIISIKGRFVTPNSIAVDAFHVHRWFRDGCSFLGLALVTILWFTAYWKRKIDVNRLSS